jgi:hypothetical protein
MMQLSDFYPDFTNPVLFRIPFPFEYNYQYQKQHEESASVFEI